jgi:hypothetical protein
MFCGDLKGQPEISDEEFFSHPVHDKIRTYLEAAMASGWQELPERVTTVVEALHQGTESILEESPGIGERALQGIYSTVVAGAATCLVTKHLNGAIIDFVSDAEDTLVVPFEKEVRDIALRVDGIRNDPRITGEDRQIQIQARQDRIDLRGRETTLTLEKRSQETADRFEDLIGEAFSDLHNLLPDLDPEYSRQIQDQCVDIFRKPFTGFVDDAKSSLVERVGGHQNF